MEHHAGSPGGVNDRAAAFMERHSGRIILAAVALTMLFVIPLLAMGTDEQASPDPGGDVFDLQDDIEERFQPLVHNNGFIVEARDGDMLTQAALWELYRNQQKLREADQRGELAPEGLPVQPYLYAAFSTETNRPFVGVTSMADAVHDLLAAEPRFGATLETATDDHVKLAVHFLLASPNTGELRDSLSVRARSERRTVGEIEADYWTSPSLVFGVLAHNERLGGGTSRSGLGGDDTILDKEEFNRNIQEALRGDQSTYRLWGIALDQNLEGQDEGSTSGFFIMLTVIAAVAVVGISLRSYWATALTGVGLGVLMVWLKGISNLVGLEGGLIIELIVPIAMIALGVDFAVHALRRYQEERAVGYPPARALRIGMAGVVGALVLAMLSDGIAFLSNASSGIEAVIHFGIAAGIASVSSFLVLGLVLPLAMMRIDRIRGHRDRARSRPAATATLVGGVGVAVLSGTGVIFLVAVSTVAGLLVLLATTVVFLVAPLMLASRRSGQHDAPQSESTPISTPDEQKEVWLVPLVSGLARYRLVVLLIVAGITAAAVVLALRLDPELDVKDFFDGESDFVVSLDKLDEHVAERGGEPAIVYVAGDLTAPQALGAVDSFVESLPANPYVGREADGRVNLWEPNLLSIVKRTMSSDYARGRISAATGVEVNDSDGDGLPDSREQIRAVFDYVVGEGVPLDESTTVYTADEVRTVLFHRLEESGDNVAVLQIGIPGSRGQTTVKNAREALTGDLERLGREPSIRRVGLTGSPFAREGQLDAATSTLRTSLPIAVAASLVLLVLAMRSLRYAVVTVIPVGLVVAWLLALMHVIGFNFNFVTATIGAISIGVGIDYSIHMTERFREELRRTADRTRALRRATAGTGVSLLASAVSSIVGFAIMGLAPMPVISTFGILTAIMIFLALVAALVVLPSLLLLVTPQRLPIRAPTSGDVRDGLVSS